ncbi:C-type lectin lectoxin-Lio2-like [Paroedura picta]|uniref:C-type lectin lectoxin-Lio2-like n=1 Tax=Paroedura picta TaxID=143630 RepID=UPI0040574FFE
MVIVTGGGELTSHPVFPPAGPTERTEGKKMGFFSSGLVLLAFAATGHFHKGADNVLSCHKYWVYSNGYCYRLFLKALPWHEAELKCQYYSETGHLISITDAHEAALVEGLIKAEKYLNEVWIGMYGYIEEAVWVDSAESDFASWGPEELNLSNDAHFYCVRLIYVKGHSRWVIANCDTPRAHICKYEL